MSSFRSRSKLTLDTESLSYINGTGIKEPDTKKFKLLTFLFIIILILWVFNWIRSLTVLIFQAKDLYGVPKWGYRGDQYRTEDRHRMAYMIGDLVIVSLFQVFGWYAVFKTNTIAYGGCVVLTILSLPLPILASGLSLGVILPIVLVLALGQLTIIIMLICEIYRTRTDFLQQDIQL